MGKPIISFTDVVKRYDDETILKGVSFEIEEGKFYTLLGPSGCGKTTILRIIAGFSEASEGDVYFEGKRINDVPANQRQVNTVFQDYALFPHMNVFENVAFNHQFISCHIFLILNGIGESAVMTFGFISPSFNLVFSFLNLVINSRNRRCSGLWSSEGFAPTRK